MLKPYALVLTPQASWTAFDTLVHNLYHFCTMAVPRGSANKDVQLKIMVDAKARRRWKQAADREGRSLSSYIRRAVELHVKETMKPY